jgi:hypothetical protein
MLNNQKSLCTSYTKCFTSLARTPINTGVQQYFFLEMWFPKQKRRKLQHSTDWKIWVQFVQLNLRAKLKQICFFYPTNRRVQVQPILQEAFQPITRIQAAQFFCCPHKEDQVIQSSYQCTQCLFLLLWTMMVSNYLFLKAFFNIYLA